MFKNLINLGISKGYLRESEIIDFTILESVELSDIENLYTEIQKNNIVIYRSTTENKNGDKSNSWLGRSRVDYIKIFDQVKKLEPNLEKYLDDIRKIRPPSKNEAQELIFRIHNNNIHAKERLVLMFVKVVIKTALFYYNSYGLNLEDTLQDGILGIYNAIESYETEKNVKFSIYFPWYVRSSIERNLNSISDVYISKEKRNILFPTGCYCL